MASFDENGKYIKTNWKAGDKITATKLNKIEESIEAVNDNDISRHVEADARLDALEAMVAEVEGVLDGMNAHLDNSPTVNVKEFGAIGDGVSDDSLAIMAAVDSIASGGTLIFPEGHYMLNAVNYKIRPKANQTFKGVGNSIIEVIPTQNYYHIFDIVSASNINIENLILIGDKDSQTIDTPVIGMGIAISGSNNITIKNCDISKMWGDGIVLGGYQGVGNSNIKIFETVSRDNARQGLSITFGEDITIKNCKFNDTDVLLPSCGIDIEPNEGEYVRNILMDNVECDNNREGLSVFAYSADCENIKLQNMMISNNRVYGLTLAHTNVVSINNCMVDNNDDIGCNFTSNNKNVVVNNLISKNNGKHGAMITTIGDGVISATRATKNFTFNNCKFNNNSAIEQGYDGFRIQLNHSTHKIENIKFNNCEFSDNQDNKTQNVGLYIENTNNISNIVLNDVTANGNITTNITDARSIDNVVHKKRFNILGNKIFVDSIDYTSSTFYSNSIIPDTNTRVFVSLMNDDLFPTKEVLPSGLSLNAAGYYIIKINDNAFQLSQTSNGTAISINNTETVNLSQFHFEWGLSTTTCDFSNIASNNVTIELDGKSPVLSIHGYLQINNDISTDAIFYDLESQQKSRPLLSAGKLGIGNILSKIKIDISCEHYLIVTVETFGIVASDASNTNEILTSKKTYYTDQVKNTSIYSVTFRSCELSIGTKITVY